MKIGAVLFFLTVTAWLVLHTYLPDRSAYAFVTAVRSGDPAAVRSLLAKEVTFHGLPYMTPDWYGFFLRETLVVGPFPIDAFHKEQPLELTLEPCTVSDWIMGRRRIGVFGGHSLRWFVASYSRVSYEQAADPDGGAGGIAK